jgi:hypothetical protein
MDFALLVFEGDKDHAHNVSLLAAVYLIYDKACLCYKASTLELLFMRLSSQPIIRSMFGSNIMLALLRIALLKTESTLPNLNEKHSEQSYLVFIFIFFTLTSKFRKFIFCISLFTIVKQLKL